MVTGVPLWDSSAFWVDGVLLVSRYLLAIPLSRYPPPHLQTVMHPPAHPRAGLSMTPSHAQSPDSSRTAVLLEKEINSLSLSLSPSLALSPSPWPGQQFLRDLRGIQTEEPSDHIIIITYQDKQLATSLFLTPFFFPESLLPHFHSLLASSTPPSRSYPTPLPDEWIVIMTGISSALCTSLLY